LRGDVAVLPVIPCVDGGASAARAIELCLLCYLARELRIRRFLVWALRGAGGERRRRWTDVDGGEQHTPVRQTSW